MLASNMINRFNMTNRLPLTRFLPLAISICALGAAQLAPKAAWAQQPVLNLYSAHYSTDEALYANFTKATGIRIQRVDADDAGILARLQTEGSSSPADVVLLVDAARLWRAQVDGLFLPVKSVTLQAAIPAHLRAKTETDGSTAWFGFSTRARVVVYDKAKVKAEDVDTYEDWPNPRTRGGCAPVRVRTPTT
jgi:iron(III) transport system substrate-binding protein